MVIATGGGTFLNLNNAKILNRKGQIICLHADSQTIYKRLKENNNRPLIKGDDILNKINYLLEKRKRIYDNFHWKIDTSNLSVQEVVDKIIELLKVER
jgi:shikimate kinase